MHNAVTVAFLVTLAFAAVSATKVWNDFDNAFFDDFSEYR